MKTQNQKLDFDKVWLTLQETHKMIKENARISKEHDKKLRKLEDMFVGQWGKLIESLIRR